MNLKNHKNDLLFLALGGANEIGMNVNLYHSEGKWLMLDLGAGFADDTLPGIDMIVADISFIVEHKKDFLGVVLTHAHEDHLGAVPYLWKELKCPIWATPFTASVLKVKLQDTDFAREVPINIVQPGSRFDIGPFNIELVQLTHSIPEMNAAMIRTKAGNILHTGDWKFDPKPMVGPESDQKKLAEFGREGVLAMTCDSTNVFNPGTSGSESDLRDSLINLVGQCKSLVAVTTFASNVARVETIAKVARAHKRKVVITGRSLFKITAAAQENGYLADLAPFISDKEMKNFRREQLLIMCTGCQGEPNAAMSKIAYGHHPTIRLNPEDTVIFSSKIIPGNEKKIYRLFNKFVDLGVEVLTERDHFVHVSGHPSRDELKKMYELVKPQIAIPVHGEKVHIHEHVKLAKEWGVPKQLQVHNGDLVKIGPGEPEKLAVVQSGYLAIDGNYLLAPDSDVIRERRKIGREGILMVSLVLNLKGDLLARPAILAPGILDQKADRDIINDIADEVKAVIGVQNRPANDVIQSVTRRALRRILKEEIGKDPNIEVQIVRVER